MRSSLSIEFPLSSKILVGSKRYSKLSTLKSSEVQLTLIPTPIMIDVDLLFLNEDSDNIPEIFFWPTRTSLGHLTCGFMFNSSKASTIELADKIESRPRWFLSRG